MKTDFSIFILACTQILGIKLPVDIRMRTRADTKRRDAAGYCESRYRKEKLIKHVLFVNIRVTVESEYPLADVIAHELVHAVMIEKGIFNSEKHHDKKFQQICLVLEKEMLKLGYKLGKLYNPETDTE